MSQIILDTIVSNQLLKLAHAVELCDPSGRVIGKYVPLIDLTEWEPISPDISEEDLDQREKSDEKMLYDRGSIGTLEELVMFQVKWRQIALDDLTNIWIQADSTQRKAITKASNALEQLLQIDPTNEGESRPNGRRITFIFPLAIRFRIESDAQTVRILHIRIFKRRNK